MFIESQACLPPSVPYETRAASFTKNARSFQNMSDPFVSGWNLANNARDLALFDMAVDSQTRGLGLLPEEMWADFGPHFFEREDFIPPQLWLGSVPTHIPSTPLHRDPLNGFLLQVMGRKLLDLYSADQADLLYPNKSYNLYQLCWFKPEAPEFRLYLKAKEAKCVSVTLNPGELIIRPAGWFHQVYAIDSPNMSVSYFWRYSRRTLVSPGSSGEIGWGKGSASSTRLSRRAKESPAHSNAAKGSRPARQQKGSSNSSVGGSSLATTRSPRPRSRPDNLSGGSTGVCQRSCPPISCSVSDFRGADFGFGGGARRVQRVASCGFYLNSVPDFAPVHLHRDWHDWPRLHDHGQCGALLA